MARTRNNVGAAPISKFRGDRLACFDALPAPIRRALHEAIGTWDPREIRWTLNKRLKAGQLEAEAIAAEVASIRDEDEAEVLAFQYYWPSRFGRYPHLAAEATIIRYDEKDLHRA